VEGDAVHHHAGPRGQLAAGGQEGAEGGHGPQLAPLGGKPGELLRAEAQPRRRPEAAAHAGAEGGRLHLRGGRVGAQRGIDPRRLAGRHGNAGDAQRPEADALHQHLVGPRHQQPHGEGAAGAGGGHARGAAGQVGDRDQRAGNGGAAGVARHAGQRAGRKALRAERGGDSEEGRDQRRGEAGEVDHGEEGPCGEEPDALLRGTAR